MDISYNLDQAQLLPKNLAEEYWVYINGDFSFAIDALAEKYGLSSREISSLISTVSSYIDFGTCSGCSNNNAEVVENRTRARQVIVNVYYHYFCSHCRDKANAYCKSLSDEDKKIVWMKLAFKYKLWTKLDKDEMNFLKAIYFLRSWNRIYHEIIKLEKDYGFKVLHKLDKMHLIYYENNELTGEIRIKMTRELQDLIRGKLI